MQAPDSSNSNIWTLTYVTGTRHHPRQEWWIFPCPHEQATLKLA